MVAAVGYLGRGAYSVADAARIVGRHYNTVRRWLSPDEGIVRRGYDPESHTISFTELMELHFINMFESQGVSFQTIRRTAAMASKKFGTDYPFTVKKFDTDGRTIFSTMVDEVRSTKTKKKELIEDLRTSQLVFGQIVKPFFKKLEYNNSDISRYWPQSKRGRVVLDPTRKFGQPIDEQTGVPTIALFQAVKAGQSIKDVAHWFEVPEAAVKAAAKFEKSLK